MSDDKEKGSEEQGKAGDTASSKAVEPKTWEDSEVKKIIAERQEFKQKLREIEEAKQKADEQKAIEEGETKKILEQRTAELATERKQREALEEKAQKYEEQQTQMRVKALERIADKDLRAIAEKLPDLSDVVAFADKYESSQAGPATGKGAKKGAESNPLKRLPGETWTQYQRRVG